MNTHPRLKELASLLADRRGAITVEYTVILVMIAIISIGAWNAYRDSVKNNINSEYTTFGYTGS